MAITILPKSTVTKDLRVLGPPQGFPGLPPIEILIYGLSGQKSAPVAALAAAVVETLDRKPRKAA